MFLLHCTVVLFYFTLGFWQEWTVAIYYNTFVSVTNKTITYLHLGNKKYVSKIFFIPARSRGFSKKSQQYRNRNFVLFYLCQCGKTGRSKEQELWTLNKLHLGSFLRSCTVWYVTRGRNKKITNLKLINMYILKKSLLLYES